MNRSSWFPPLLVLRDDPLYRLFEVATFAKALMLVSFFDSTQTSLNLSALLKQVGEAEVGTGGYLMGLRGVEQLQSLREECIGGSEIPILMVDLSQGNQCLSLGLCIVT